MGKLSNRDLKLIEGGKTVSATLINVLVKGFNTFFNFGQYLGSSIRRYTSKGNCALR